ncbi:hypothetical protein PRIPAC_70354 [Pristionchus pacificus]|uniref:Uncharacterized protein n=1 Tax=Pristionchus pacificus TaxID=54126 RepID=A0A2A6C6V0_PRIPA|nr:hypothetical protein PRIPAC_70354 [Pristionchus pacificus]|eukprot:PDM73904.1 hypothetical protein PRIPAC_41260 [Pristionchus pacificus]
MRELLLPLLLLFDIADAFGSQCGCALSDFSAMCPPGQLCFNKLIEKGCDITCSTGDLRYLSSFTWHTSPFLRCEGGQYRRPNGTVMSGVSQLVCTQASPCNKCPTISFNDYCEGSYKCENTLTTTVVDEGCSRMTCQKGDLMVKNGKQRFLMTKSLTCSSDGVWHTAEGDSIDATEATCTMKRDCQSCDTPPFSTACSKNGEMMCDRSLIQMIGGLSSSQCRKITCKDSQVTALTGDVILTDIAISCNPAGKWVLDTSKLELASNLEVTCSVPLCETCIELKLTADCPPEGRCNNGDVLNAGGPSQIQCSRVSCASGQLAIKEGAIWVEATALSCDGARKWVTEHQIAVSNTAAVTCAQYKCDACPEVVADPQNRCPKDAAYCHREYLRYSPGASSGRPRRSHAGLANGARKLASPLDRMLLELAHFCVSNINSTWVDNEILIVASCAYNYLKKMASACSACPPIQTIVNAPDGSTSVLALETVPNSSNCASMDCGEGEIAMYQNGVWRDVRSLTCNYDKQWYVIELEQLKEPYPEGRPVTDYFLVKCTKAKACDHCQELGTTGECHNGFCNPNLLERSMDVNGCKKIACARREELVEDFLSEVQIWKPVSPDAKVTCKADHAPPPCQNCTFSMISGSSRIVVDGCLIVHCRPKGKNVKVFSRYWGTYLEVWYMRCTEFGWMSQSSVLINDIDPFTITARCD